jgi:hypothetical protein
MNVVFISCTKTVLIYTIAQMTIIDLVVLRCIPWHFGYIPRLSASFEGSQQHSKAVGCIRRHSAKFQCTRQHSQGLNFYSDKQSMEEPYESANRQGRLRARIIEYTKPPSETKAIGNSFCIVLCILIIKTTIFAYEIKHLDSLTEILLLTISSNTIFPHTVQ